MSNRLDIGELDWLTRLLPSVLVLAIAWFRPQLCARWFHRGERLLGRLAGRRGRAIAVVGVVAFALSAALSLAIRMPLPVVHDEFSYLLAADTFAHGRLANPSHPLWMHFESFQILQQPTYASKFPPAQGLLLAAGQVATDRPIVGAWAGHSLECAAICWMLMAWLPHRWALVGGLLCTVHPSMILWSQCFWGGNVAVAAGALVLGAWRRITQQPRAADGWMMGIGIAVLANSRPYEGLVLTVCVLLHLLCKFMRKGSWRRQVRPVILPLGIVLTANAGWMGYYNWRVTGDPLRLPHREYQSQYQVVQPLWCMPPHPPPLYRHELMQRLSILWELTPYTAQRTPREFAKVQLAKLKTLADCAVPVSFIGLPSCVLLIGLLAIPWLWRDPWQRRAVVVCLGFGLGLVLESWMLGHYAAPVAGLICLLAIQTMRLLWTWRPRGRACGRFLVRVVWMCSLAAIVPTVAQLTPAGLEGYWAFQRARIVADLHRSDDWHLILVRYRPTHSPHCEWVYNEAEIDGARIVWAREMDEAHNRQLLNYFHNRRAWLLEADAQPPRLVPYPLPVGSKIVFAPTQGTE